MYGNDYSWVPEFLAGYLAVAAFGALLLSFIRLDRFRLRLMWAWLFVPILLSAGLGVFAAIYGENLNPSYPILFVPIFTVIFLPPWLIGTLPIFAISRFLQEKFATQGD